MDNSDFLISDMGSEYVVADSKNCDTLSRDLCDLLPSDPFLMNHKKTGSFGMDDCFDLSDIATLIGDVGMDLGLSNAGAGKDENKKQGEGQLAKGIDLVWTRTMTFYTETDGKPAGPAFNSSVIDKLCGSLLLLDCSSNELTGSSDKSDKGCTVDCSDFGGNAPPPHLAFNLALYYLGVKDLLSVERVCKDLRNVVQTDPLLWRSICIDQPLNEAITDGALIKLAERAQGSLQCLSLVGCFKITDSGLKSVLERNTGLTKLNVPGCLRLSVGGVLHNLKASMSAGGRGIKQLRFGSILGATKMHLDEFMCMLGSDNRAHGPRFYSGSQMHLPLEDQRPIDIEECPRCPRITQVYDCPSESCRGKQVSCRGCIICINRCISCGCCIDGYEYEETFTKDFICMECFKQLFDCNEGLDESNSSSDQAVFHQQASYRFRIYI